MTTRSVNWVLAQRVGAGNLKATLMAIALSSPDGEKVSLERVGEENYISRRTLRRHVIVLEKAGFVRAGRGSVSLVMESAS